MNVLWIVAAIGIFALATWIAWAYEHEHAGPSGLGYVSHRWLEEHRLSQIDRRFIVRHPIVV